MCGYKLMGRGLVTLRVGGDLRNIGEEKMVPMDKAQRSAPACKNLCAGTCVQEPVCKNQGPEVRMYIFVGTRTGMKGQSGVWR